MNKELEPREASGGCLQTEPEKVVSGNEILSLFAPSLLKHSLLMQGENDFMYIFQAKNLKLMRPSKEKPEKKELFPWVLPEVIKIVMWDKCRA